MKNCQTVKMIVYVHSSLESVENNQREKRRHHPASVMVWWGVSFDGGVTQQHFCEQKVKTHAIKYQSDIL